METPYYSEVPKGIQANLFFRRFIIEEAGRDPEYAAALEVMCSKDILFYINVFGWTKDPRIVGDIIKPFVTYDFQDDAILEACDCILNGSDLVWPKTRTMGASWMGMVVFEWFWHFYGDLELGIISRKEELVDQAGNTKSLMGKIDFIHDYLPKWLRPRTHRIKRHLYNLDNNSTIIGETTNKDPFRSARLTACFIDEFAAFEPIDGWECLKATREVTKCRIFCSTPKGAANAFWHVVYKTAAIKRFLHWLEHPIYSQGAYTTGEDGKVKHIDKNFTGTVKSKRIDWVGEKEFEFPGEYPFILDGKTRSPWYDTEEARCGSKTEMAQEVDINFMGSDNQFFDPEFINKLKAEYCIDPIVRGNITFKGDDCEPEGIVEFDEGPLHLWFELNPRTGAREFISDREFGIGADVSAGIGASNSVASVVDLRTGRKIAMWKDANTYPKDFAEICVALARLFNDAIINWDAGGSTGSTFSNTVAKIGYSNLYYMVDETTHKQKISQKPGFFLNPVARGVALREYRSALNLREFINLSKSGMNETLQFIREPGGKAVHSASKYDQDPGANKEAHGDECMADTVACKLLSSEMLEEGTTPQRVPDTCMAVLLEEYEHEQMEKELEYW